MKGCFKCGETKPLLEFYAHPDMADGHLNKCKTCAKKDVARRYNDPAARGRIVAYERARQQNPERRRLKLEYGRTHRQRNPGRARARNKVHNAVRDGRLDRKPCGVCGSTKVEAHHTDYRRPLVVQWLSRKHHMLVEGKRPF